MADADNQSTGTSLTEGMTQEQFEALLKKDVSEWLTAFLSNFPFQDERGEGYEAEEKKIFIEEIEEYQYFNHEHKVLGFHIKHKETEGGEYDCSDITEVFGIYKDGELVTYFAVDGTYSSYEYSNYNDHAYEVEKREVKVMKWLPKGK
jgi:hypothetical protein